MMLRNQSAVSEFVATKEDCAVFGKTPKVMTRVCPQDGSLRKCNAVCTTCPYTLAKIEVEQCQNRNTTH